MDGRWVIFTKEEISRLNDLLKQAQKHRNRARKQYQRSHPIAEIRPQKNLTLLRPHIVFHRATNQWWAAPESDWQHYDQAMYDLYVNLDKDTEQYLRHLLERSEQRRIASQKYYRRMNPRKDDNAAALLNRIW